MATISHSEVDSLLLCERKHYYGYGLGIQRIEESDALNRGTLGHLVLEFYYKGVKGGLSLEAMKKPTMEYLRAQATGTNMTLVAEVADLLKNFYFKADSFANYKILAVEEPLVLDISPEVSMPYIPDMIVQDPARRIAVVDHKFMYDFFTPRDVGNSPQIVKYIGAMRAMGMRADYGIYDQLRYRKIKEPRMDQKIDVLPFFPTENRILRTFEEQLMVTEKVVARKAMPVEEQSYVSLRVNNKMVCKSCSFNSICVAELNDTNPDLVMKSEYKLRERRTFEPSDLLVEKVAEDV